MKRRFECRKRSGDAPDRKIDGRGGGKGRRSGVVGGLLRRKLALGGKHTAHGIARAQLLRLRITAGGGKRIDGGGRRDDEIAAEKQTHIGKDGEEKGSGDTARQTVLIQLHLLRPGDFNPVSAQKRANLSFSFRRSSARRDNCIRILPDFIGNTLMMHLSQPVNHAKRDFAFAHDDRVGAVLLQLIDLGVGMGAGFDPMRLQFADALVGILDDEEGRA